MTKRTLPSVAPTLVGPQDARTPVYYTKGSENFHGDKTCTGIRANRAIGPRTSPLHAALLTGRTACLRCCKDVTMLPVQQPAPMRAPAVA